MPIENFIPTKYFLRQHLQSLVFFITLILLDERYCLIVAWVCISLTILFVMLNIFHILVGHFYVFFEKLYSDPLPIFNWVIWVLLLNCII
jgi:hypothetical protein